MKSIFTSILFCFLILCKITAQIPPPSSTSNKGTEFWVAYGHHQYFEAESINTQDMTIYLSVGDLPAGVGYATVNIEIDSSDANYANWYRREYQIPANTVISIDDSASVAYLINYSPSCINTFGPIPKGAVNSVGCGDYRVLDPLPPNGTGGERIFRNRGIHITSNEAIVAYAHIYGSANSGATMLIPYNSWGLHYTSVNSVQADASAAFSFFYVIAANNNTPVKIVPSQPSRMGKPAKVPIYVTLQKGQIYQYVGQADAGGYGVQLTGSIIESLDSSKPIAVFSGSSRTRGEKDSNCHYSTRDNDMQQCFPQETWGVDFLTAPFSTAQTVSAITPSVFARTAYKVIARDSNTIVTVNDTSSINLAQDTFYLFSNNLPNKIHANHPIMVAQFMFSNNCSVGSSKGDPEMIYLSPTERGVKQTGFYRNTQEYIDVNFVTLIVPSDGLNTLTINNLPYNSGTNVFTTKHTLDTNYTIVVKGWASQREQCIVKCDKRFTGVTYGLGGIESYGYNVGSNFYLNTPNVYPTVKPKIKGTIFCDMNSNGVFDNTEFPKANVKVELSNGNFTFSNINGYYEIDADSLGSYTTVITPPTFFTAVPSPNVYYFTKYDTVVNTDIALKPVIAAKDSAIAFVVPYYATAFKGSQYPYFITYENIGTKTMNATFDVKYSSTLLAYDSCSDAQASHSVTDVSVTTNNLNPGQRKNVVPYFTIKPSANIGDSLKTVYSITGGTLSLKDSFTVVIEAIDSTIGQKATPAISPTQIASGKSIEYVINFRNANTYSIKNLRITDTLSSLLQANSLQIVNASHPCKVLVKGNKVLFEFLNINLHDQSINRFKSFGYIKFKVRPKSSVAIGDFIDNSASLYFDYDNAVETNLAITVVNASGSLPLKLINYTCLLEDSNKVLNSWKTASEINFSHFNILRSVNGKDFTFIGKVLAIGNNNYSFTDAHLPLNIEGATIYYRLEMVDKDGTKNLSEIKIVRLKKQDANLVVYPNPSRGNITIESFDSKELIISDYLGRQVFKKQILNNAHSITQVYNLEKGLYLIEILSISGDKKIKKLIVQ